MTPPVRDPRAFWPAVVLSTAIVAAMAVLRLTVYPRELVPLSYTLPLLLALWHRDARILWGMAAGFAVLVVVKMLWVLPDDRLNQRTYILFGSMQMVNIVVAATVLHLVLVLGERLRASMRRLEQTNHELGAINEELAAQEEEINQQNEELQSQSLELEQQMEESTAQAEELQTLNAHLSEREKTLSDMLQPYVSGGTEEEVLAHMGAKITRLLGGRAAAATLCEPRDDLMRVRPLFGIAGPPRDVPRRQTLAELVMLRNRAATLGDVSLRSDLEFPTLRDAPARSVIAAPLRTPDGGALEVYASSPDAWSDEDIRLVQWLGVQCGRLWTNVRLRHDIERDRALLSTITDHASAALIMTDPDGVCTYINPAAERLMCRPFSQASGRPLHELLFAGRGGTDGEGRSLHGRPGTREECLVQPDGTAVPVRCSVIPVLGDSGVRCVVIELQDLRESRAHEEERERLLGRERAAREEAEEACRARDEFVATLSHELRTPLNAVLGWATLLRQSVDDPEEVRNGIGVIERNARHQAQLISDLLDVSRIASGKLALSMQPTDPVQLVNAAIDSTFPAVRAKGVHLVREFDAPDAVIWADPDRVQQVVWNLLTNAVKFTPPGGTVRVALSQREDSLVIEVADTGQGIEPDLLPHMFDRYRQADGSPTRRQGGLGIGLAIVKHLVELHAGTVQLKSPGPGRGTTCTVELPLHDPAAAGHGMPAAIASSALPADLPDLKGLAVLVVDDEEDARSLVGRFLRGRGATVWTAGSAEEAFRLLCDERIDMLISDIGMPGADGYSLMRRVRAECPDHVRHVPAVALTAFARSADRTQSLLAGFHAHVSKPVEPLELLATVASLRASLLRDRGDEDACSPEANTAEEAPGTD
jgi:PAS domain S-box-containing protein